MFKSIRFLPAAFVCAVAMLLTACASSGPTFSEAQAKAAPVATDQGRIYFYRPASMVGSAVQPSIMLNGEKVGSSIPGGYFSVDRAPGDYKVSASTEVERDLTFTLEAGQTRYVRTDISMGFFAGHVSPVLVDADKALAEIKDCHFTGNK